MELPKSIKETQEGLLAKKFNTVGLVDAYLAQIDKENDKLNIFLTVAKELAYEQAKKADKQIAELGADAFKGHPLMGVCSAYKDLFLAKGIRTTAASKVLEDYVPAYSATVVKKLEGAGAICLGKLNCDAWAHGSSGENSDFGSTKNPHNPAYVPGGSSSGGGAALAAKMALVTLGTDTCGSIRLPANFCGVVGLKPTYGAVSRYGVIAMASSLDCVGPLTINVEDSEKVFNVIKGEDGKDATVINQKSKVKNQNHSSKFKVGIPREYFAEGIDREVEKAVLEAIEIYKKKGVELVDVSLPHTKYAISAYYIIQPAEVSSNLARFDGIRYGKGRDLFGEEAKRRIMLGTYVLSAGYYDAYYLTAMKVRSKIIEDVEKVFNPSADGVDALIAPVSPTPPFKLGEKVNDPLKMYLTDIFAATANLSGICAIAIPSGFTKNNLPLGFQLMAPKFSENILFDLGKLFEGGRHD